MKLDSIKSFLRDEDGAAAVEYAILVSLIATAVVAAVNLYDIDGIFGDVSNKVKNLVK